LHVTAPCILSLTHFFLWIWCSVWINACLYVQLL